MVWIHTSKGGDCTHEILLGEASHLKTDLATWVKDIAAKEIANLAAAGIRALPLQVRSCGSILMSETSGAQDGAAKEHVFNRVRLSTGFDLARVSSLQTSLQLHSFAGTQEQHFFCVMCLMRVDTKTCGVVKPPMFLSFPFVFQGEINPLTHWALGNSRNEFHYIIRSNVRLPTEGSAGIQFASTPVATDQHLNHGDHDSKVSGVKAFALIQERWQDMTQQQKLDALSFSDSEIFERILLDFRTLTASEISRTDPMESKSKSLTALLKQFPLLSCLIFQKTSKAAVMSLQPAFVQHSALMWSTLEAVAPKLFSGKFRRRRDMSEWLALLEQPARNFLRLQQRITQLIEQKLWSLADGSNAKVLQPRRRRRKIPISSKTEAPPKHVTSSTELEVTSDAETVANSDGGATEATTSTEVDFDVDEIDALLRECFIYQDNGFSEKTCPIDELQ